MRKALLILFASLSLTLGIAGTASAEPSNFPTNPNACRGNSATTANAAFQDIDSAKFRDEQARGEAVFGVTGEQGRKDDVRAIPQCQGIK